VGFVCVCVCVRERDICNTTYPWCHVSIEVRGSSKAQTVVSSSFETPLCPVTWMCYFLLTSYFFGVVSLCICWGHVLQTVEAVSLPFCWCSDCCYCLAQRNYRFSLHNAIFKWNFSGLLPDIFSCGGI